MSYPPLTARPHRTRLGGTSLLLLLVAVPAVPSASASLHGVDPGEGLLAVSSDPPVATQIRVGDIERNTGNIKGLPFPIGEHLACFSGPDECLVPDCETDIIEDGKQTSFVGQFLRSVELEVVVEPFDSTSSTSHPRTQLGRQPPGSCCQRGRRPAECLG